MIRIDEQFQKITEELIRNSQEQQSVVRDHVFQPANRKNRVLVEKIVSALMLPGSTITGYENLAHLHKLSQEGHSCLMLVEHYSNFDLPCLFCLAGAESGGAEITDSIVAMAGAKLNEESRFILAFTEAYTRIVIYPARTLAALEETPEYPAARARSREINRSALREMIRMKNSGHIILLFPAGTRYRPGKPETKTVLLETDSYIKGFDYLVTTGIAGNTLRVDQSGNMEKDVPATDVMVYSVGPVTSTADFRAEARRGAGESMEETKRAVAKAVEREFAERHAEAEQVRETVLEDLARHGVAPASLEMRF